MTDRNKNVIWSKACFIFPEMGSFEMRIKPLTAIYWTTSLLATTDADIRFAGSTEYSARAFLIALT